MIAGRETGHRFADGGNHSAPSWPNTYFRLFTSYKSQKHSFGICSAQLIASSAKAWA